MSPSGSSKSRAQPRCKRCGRSIRVPGGWSAGPAVRRHYWRRHREVMQPHPRRDAR